MAMKGFSIDQLSGPLSHRLGAGSPPKKYLFRNIGVEQLGSCKRAHIFLQREDTGAHRLLSVFMNQKDTNWVALRKNLLGAKDPAASKHSEALKAITAALATEGGLSLTETRSTGNSSNTFVISCAKAYSADTELVPFSSMRSSKGVPLKTEKIKSLFGDAGAGSEQPESKEEEGWDISSEAEDDDCAPLGDKWEFWEPTVHNARETGPVNAPDLSDI